MRSRSTDRGALALANPVAVAIDLTDSATNPYERMAQWPVSIRQIAVPSGSPDNDFVRQNSSGMSFWTNDGTGTFQSAGSQTTVSWADGVLAADIER
ncbi:MAG: hypothetical protein IPK26_13275 [Planctomycetes bacterium]|nr:hypothetical protein [Planctomycetota bacterium]